MAPKRPSLSSASPSCLPTKKAKFDDGQRIRVHIVSAKLDPTTLSRLCDHLDNPRPLITPANNANAYLVHAPSAEKADVIVTAVHMRKRFERHLDWDVARQKHVVTTKWLEESMASSTLLPYADFIAIPELRQPAEPEHEDEDIKVILDSSQLSQADMACLIPQDKVQTHANVHYRQQLSCLRESPLKCANQGLVEQLRVIERQRYLEGDATGSLSYERAIAAVKAFPWPITYGNLHSKVAKIPYIGEKMLSKISNYLDDGEIEESQEIATSERYQALSSLSQVYGIGPLKAQELFHRGVRSIDDLERHFDVEQHELQDAAASSDTSREKKSSGSVSEKNVPILSTKAAIRLRADLEKKIARSEVEEIRDAVMHELDFVRQGCVSTVTGGYRRGKLWSNDVDIVITHPSLKSGASHIRGLCEELVGRLCKQGLVTNVMHLSGFHAHNALRASHWDSLQKALTVFKLPDVGERRRTHRRVDLIFAEPNVYWTAVAGWTGSKMFERDLRHWAKEHGFKFDSSGITRRRDSKLYLPRTEEEVFHMLGLPWIDPTLRNAD
ncbi:Nucleotidyltransferase [Cylindrobasidium torrendii FP15055 ss-10]|uniref:DNA-directed DNA polymerase n=1 Tax=Cylindrobasidium torrendii FP15055 ss-10 TaxID=1314674 RepID=A0A0D7BH09_9AGAR|nr:Nucleotidyltransferase [Cylindrobasidium torrendii FP15055 ss-10]